MLAELMRQRRGLRRLGDTQIEREQRYRDCDDRV
jgi:hypothetical protein